ALRRNINLRRAGRWRWEHGARILLVGSAELHECIRRVLVDIEATLAHNEHAKASSVGMARQWKSGRGVMRTGFDLPWGLIQSSDQPETERVHPAHRNAAIKREPDVAALLCGSQSRPLAVLAEGPELAPVGCLNQRVDCGDAASVDIQRQHIRLLIHRR